MPPDLYFEERGSPGSHPLIFLHGLLGSSRNWRSVAKVLSSDFRTLCFDLPNHGQSMQQSESSVASMSEIVIKQIGLIGLENFFLCQIQYEDRNYYEKCLVDDTIEVILYWLFHPNH